MLSYQHAYHAGNPADVHKHVALVMLLARLRQKPAPFCFVDSHAGRGIYDLAGGEAQKTGEAAQGIVKLRQARIDSPAVREYLELVATARDPSSTTDSRLRWYPGSAALAAAMLRDDDRGIFLEKHPRELEALRKVLGRDRRIAIHDRDTFEGLPALLPPPIRRGLVLVDPSYEEKDEYRRIAALVANAFSRWSNGIFVVWYPLLPDGRERVLERELGEQALPKTIVSRFRFSTTAVGLQGSGLVVVNAPWRFAAELDEAMTAVIAAICPDAGRHEIQGDDTETPLGQSA